MGQRRTPGVEDGGEADAGAEMLRVGGDGGQRLGRRSEQEVVDAALLWNAMAPIAAGRSSPYPSLVSVGRRLFWQISVRSISR